MTSGRGRWCRPHIDDQKNDYNLYKRSCSRFFDSNKDQMFSSEMRDYTNKHENVFQHMNNIQELRNIRNDLETCLQKRLDHTVKFFSSTPKIRNMRPHHDAFLRVFYDLIKKINTRLKELVGSEIKAPNLENENKNKKGKSSEMNELLLNVESILENISPEEQNTKLKQLKEFQKNEQKKREKQQRKRSKEKRRKQEKQKIKKKKLNDFESTKFIDVNQVVPVKTDQDLIINFTNRAENVLKRHVDLSEYISPVLTGFIIRVLLLEIPDLSVSKLRQRKTTQKIITKHFSPQIQDIWFSSINNQEIFQDMKNIFRFVKMTQPAVIGSLKFPRFSDKMDIFVQNVIREVDEKLQFDLILIGSEYMFGSSDIRRKIFLESSGKHSILNAFFRENTDLTHDGQSIIDENKLRVKKIKNKFLQTLKKQTQDQNIKLNDTKINEIVCVLFDIFNEVHVDTSIVVIPNNLSERSFQRPTMVNWDILEQNNITPKIIQDILLQVIKQLKQLKQLKEVKEVKQTDVSSKHRTRIRESFQNLSNRDLSDLVEQVQAFLSTQ